MPAVASDVVVESAGRRTLPSSPSDPLDITPIGWDRLRSKIEAFASAAALAPNAGGGQPGRARRCSRSRGGDEEPLVTPNKAGEHLVAIVEPMRRS